MKRHFLLVFVSVCVLMLLVMTPWVSAQENGPQDGIRAVVNGPPSGTPQLPNNADAYGSNTQWTVIHASQWEPWAAGSNPGYYSAGYIYPESSGDDFWTQVNLPVGAEVVQVQWLVYDNDANCGWYMTFGRYESGYGAEGPSYEQLALVNHAASETPGYVQEFANVDVIIHAYEDIDGDGHYHFVSYNLGAQTLACGGTNDLQLFGGVLVWHRTISPAPANATFNDVQPGDFGFQQVEALAASGITAGCGNGNFCPNATLTRVQMAVFLAKALGLHWAF